MSPEISCSVTEKMNEREMRVEEAVDRMELNPVFRKHTKKHIRILHNLQIASRLTQGEKRQKKCNRRHDVVKFFDCLTDIMHASGNSFLVQRECGNFHCDLVQGNIPISIRSNILNHPSAMS